MAIAAVMTLHNIKAPDMAIAPTANAAVEAVALEAAPMPVANTIVYRDGQAHAEGMQGRTGHGRDRCTLRKHCATRPWSP
jgi:hypothetical protein